MKKDVLYFLIFISMISCFNLTAQEKSDLSSSIMLMYSPLDGSGKVASETTSIGKDHVGYAYAELSGFSGGRAEAYGQFFWEQKFWDKPIYIHTEYRGLAADSFYESTAYAGAAHKMNSALDIYSQTRLFVKVYKRLSTGVIGTIYYSPENVISKGVYLSLRWRL